MAEAKAFAALRIVTGVIFLVHGVAKLQKGRVAVCVGVKKAEKRSG